MPDAKGNLYLFEALELRSEYDRHIKLLESLLGSDDEEGKGLRFLRDASAAEEKEPAEGVDRKVLEERCKKLQTKRIKLNQAIQMANFEAEIDFDGQKISVAEALEIRKNLLADNKAVAQRVADSAYKRVIHKEERDIVREPKQSFSKTYEEFLDNSRQLRQLINQTHKVNHQSTVKFKDE